MAYRNWPGLIAATIVALGFTLAYLAGTQWASQVPELFPGTPWLSPAIMAVTLTGAALPALVVAQRRKWHLEEHMLPKSGPFILASLGGGLIGAGICTAIWIVRAEPLAVAVVPLGAMAAAVILMPRVKEPQFNFTPAPPDAPTGYQQAWDAPKAATLQHGAPETAQQDFAAPAPKPPQCLEVIQDTGVTFTDVIGMQEAKQELSDAIKLAEDDELAKKFGLDPVTGILLHGPPGTGKTYFAKAAAGQFNRPFYYVNTAEMVGGIVGETEKNIQAVFRFARENAPCILFMDEVDAIARTRKKAHYSWESTKVNQLLQEMDGMTSGKKPIIIAATNNKEELDAAIMRPGRFTRHIFVGPATAADAEAMIKHFLAGKLVDDVTGLGATLAGHTPAQIRDLTQQILMAKYRTGKEPRVTRQDIAEAL